MNLASQISCMSGFAAAGNMAAFNAAWSAVSVNVLPAMGLGVEQLGVPLSPPDNFALAADMRNRVIEGVRPALDQQLTRFVDTHQPLTSETFESEGFEGPVGAIMLADKVYDHNVVSFDPAKMFIASALTLVERSPVAISHVPLKYGSRGLESYRYTYHPMEEMRIQAEIDRLRVEEKPLGFRRIPHLSRGVLIRIIEQIAKAHGLPHLRLLGRDNFRTRMPGWKAQVQGLYKFYRDILPEGENAGRIVDFMLDSLGVQRFDELSLSDQARYLRLRYSRINWDIVGHQLKEYLLFRLAEEAGVVHPRFLTSDHFREFEIEELGSTLIGLYDNYKARLKEHGRVVEAILNDAGVASFESLAWDVQLKGLGERDNVKWDVVPASTQLKLLEIAKERMPVKNGLKCPHLRVLIADQLKVLVIGEIEVSLGGLYERYRRKLPEDNEDTILDFMLDRLGVERLEDLPYELQCLCLRYDEKRPWNRVPASLILKFIERLREINDLPHVRFVSAEQMQTTIIPEIGQSLGGLYHHFLLRKRADDHREIVDIILDHTGAPGFEEMPLRLQLQWTQQQSGKLASWRRMPEGVIRYYLFEVMRAAGVRRCDDLLQRHFRLRVGGKKTALMGLYTYLGNLRAGTGENARTIDWAFSRYGMDVQFSVEAKRSGGGKMLDQREKMFLMEMAKMGDRTATDHLIFFYQPLIASIVYGFRSRAGGSRLTMDELLQFARIEFSTLLGLYDPTLGSFETYVKSSLPWRVLTAIKRSGRTIHLPVYYVDFMRQVGRVRRQLLGRLERDPSDEELAGALGVTVDTLKDRQSRFTTEVSLFSPLGGDDDEFTYESVIEDVNALRPDNEYLDTDMRELIEQAINGSGLNEKEKIVMTQRGFGDRTLEEVGQMLDLSRERIRQLAQSAMRKIAEGPYAEILKEIL